MYRRVKPTLTPRLGSSRCARAMHSRVSQGTVTWRFSQRADRLSKLNYLHRPETHSLHGGETASPPRYPLIAVDLRGLRYFCRSSREFLRANIGRPAKEADALHVSGISDIPSSCYSISRCHTSHVSRVIQPSELHYQFFAYRPPVFVVWDTDRQVYVNLLAV